VTRAWALFAATVALTVVAGIVHFAVGNDAGTFASAVPLILVAPLIAVGCDGLAPKVSASLLGIIQSAFGNAAELALTIAALADGLPDVVRFALAGSILGNAIFLGGVAGLMPFTRARGRELEPLRFDRQLFTGITTLSFISVLPIALLSFPTAFSRNVHNDQTVSLAAGIALLVAGAFFIYSELQRPHRPARGTDAAQARPPISPNVGILFLATGGVVAALTADWFVAGFEPAIERLGIPVAFASLIIIPFLGNVAENYVALRYAWRGQGDEAMAVIMHSVIQIALIVTGILLVLSRFVGPSPLTLRYDPVLALTLVLSLIALWMIVHDGEMEPTEAVGLLIAYGILGAAVWTE
jgi:Ca2+:H+ antiporter